MMGSDSVNDAVSTVSDDFAAKVKKYAPMAYKFLSKSC